MARPMSTIWEDPFTQRVSYGLIRTSSAITFWVIHTLSAIGESLSQLGDSSPNLPPFSFLSSSKLSLKCADEARQTVLSFFDAPPGYVCIFTPNASGALKLVGESYPFEQGSSYILCADSHNSVHGIRQFATQKGATVSYIPSTPVGGMELSVAKVCLPSSFDRKP